MGRRAKSKDPYESINRRLDALIALRIEEIIANKEIGIGQIYTTMYNAGLTPTEIGQIVDRPAKDITATLSMYKKGKNKIGKLRSKTRMKRELVVQNSSGDLRKSV